MSIHGYKQFKQFADVNVAIALEYFLSDFLNEDWVHEYLFLTNDRLYIAIS
jgi:hypothetical protein